jgi:hypothetical protein
LLLEHSLFVEGFDLESENANAFFGALLLNSSTVRFLAVELKEVVLLSRPALLYGCSHLSVKILRSFDNFFPEEKVIFILSFEHSNKNEK